MIPGDYLTSADTIKVYVVLFHQGQTGTQTEDSQEDGDDLSIHMNVPGLSPSKIVVAGSCYGITGLIVQNGIIVHPICPQSLFGKGFS